MIPVKLTAEQIAKLAEHLKCDVEALHAHLGRAAGDRGLPNREDSTGHGEGRI